MSSRKARRDRVGQARERADAQRRAERARHRRNQLITAAVTVVVLAVLGVVIGVVVAHRPSSGSASTDHGIPKKPITTATGRTTPPPWPVPTDVTAAVNRAGLSMLSAEGTVEHIHAHLDILDDGRPVTVPAQIGIDTAAQRISPLHTHDTTGIVHVESPVRGTFTLGQFFTEWRVALSANAIGGLRAGNGSTVRAYVNGRLRAGNPAGIEFHDHDEIALVYGPSKQNVRVPRSYQWPSGY